MEDLEKLMKTSKFNWLVSLETYMHRYIAGVNISLEYCALPAKTVPIDEVDKVVLLTKVELIYFFLIIYWTRSHVLLLLY